MFRNSLLLLAFVLLMFGEVQAEPSVWDKNIEDTSGENTITVYRDKNCGCCKDWIAHLEKHNFKIIDRISGNMSAIKQEYGVSRTMASCHTAIIDGYIIEGHVPANDIKSLLKSRPDIAGLSVPQMPHGTPGMERSKRKDPFVVMQFKKSGEFDSFKEYWSY